MFSLTHEPIQEIYKRELTEDSYLQAIALYLASIQNTSQQIESSRGPVYLYGAAQMLPSLIYHFSESAISKICGIIDDNPLRQHRYYPNIDIQISSSKEISNLADSTIVISALDSSRAILSQLLVLNPRTLIIPNGLI
jgi:FlaA1/EpsC-like NDP-sugar epimerase